MPHPTFLVHVMGVTNAGKSTFIAKAPAAWGRVEVGKMMRAKYPPDYFKGSAAPAHTAAEAWQMYLAGIADCEDRGCGIVLVDGQPRDHKQTDAVLASRRHGRFLRMFLHLWAPAAVLTERARARDAGDAAKMALSQQRLRNDVGPNYDILCRLVAANESVVAFDTTTPTWIEGAVCAVKNIAGDNDRQGGL
jgi:hypothetical protein